MSELERAFTSYLETRDESRDIDFDEISTIFNELDDFAMCKLTCKHMMKLLNIPPYNGLTKLANMTINASSLLRGEERETIDLELERILNKVKCVWRQTDKKRDEKAKIEELRASKKVLSEYLDNINYDEDLNDKLYDYFWHLINDVRIEEFTREIIVDRNRYIEVDDTLLTRLLVSSMDAYLETYEKYYLRVISMIFENMMRIEDSASFSQIIEKINEKKRTIGKDFTDIKRIEYVISHYVKVENNHYILKNADRASNELLPHDANIIDKTLDWIYFENRKDLTNLKTISIEKEGIPITEAFSIMESGEDTILYTHIADLTEYIDEKGAMNEVASSMGSINMNGTLSSSFNREFLHRFISLNPGCKRLTITVKTALDKNFNIKSVEIAPSIIKVDANINGYNEEATLTDLIYTATEFNRAHGINLEFVDLSTTLEHIANLSVAKIVHENNRPIIYRYVVPTRDRVKNYNIGDFVDYSYSTWENREAERLSSVSKRVGSEVTIYSPKYLGDMTLVKSEAPITRPDKDYIALENIRILKNFLIGEELQKELNQEWMLRMSTDSLVANETFAKGEIKRHQKTC